MTLTVGSLFSGIGGLDLGLERAGMDVIWQSEIDPYACKILAKHWKDIPNYGNIKEINWGDVVRPDVICGGYPCQPFSTAGKRNGTDDPRHLWPWVREAISILRPRYAILENVRGHVSLGLDVVLREMASIGYDAEWQIVSAASVGAPHRRDRVIIVAYPDCGRQQTGQSDIGSQSQRGFACQSSEQCTDTIGELANTDSVGHLRRQSQIFTADRWLNALSLIGSCSTEMANTDSIGLEGQRPKQQTTGTARSSQDAREPLADPHNTGSRTPTSGTDRNGTQEIQKRANESQCGLGGRSTDVANNDSKRNGLNGSQGIVEQTRSIGGHLGRREETNVSREWWQVEPDVGRVAHGVPSRVDRLKGLGNAVVPQVAELVGRMVIDYDNQ